jgi:hypothetical protein
VVNLRFGIILDPTGGALQKMLLPARFGLGGRIGNGEQWFSWIGLNDAVEAILFCLERELVSGPVNIVAPNPVRNRELAATLGGVLRRPTLLPIPASLLRFVLRDCADEMFLASVRVFPQVLLDHGFRFAYEELEPLLKNALQHHR